MQEVNVYPVPPPSLANPDQPISDETAQGSSPKIKLLGKVKDKAKQLKNKLKKATSSKQKSDGQIQEDHTGHQSESGSEDEINQQVPYQQLRSIGALGHESNSSPEITSTDDTTKNPGPPDMLQAVPTQYLNYGKTPSSSTQHTAENLSPSVGQTPTASKEDFSNNFEDKDLGLNPLERPPVETTSPVTIANATFPDDIVKPNPLFGKDESQSGFSKDRIAVQNFEDDEKDLGIATTPLPEIDPGEGRNIGREDAAVVESHLLDVPSQDQLHEAPEILPSTDFKSNLKVGDGIQNALIEDDLKDKDVPDEELGLNDTVVSKFRNTGSEPDSNTSERTVSSSEGGDIQQVAPQQGPDTIKRNEDEQQPTSLPEEVAGSWQGLKDGVASKVGGGGGGSTRTSESTDVHHAQSDASQQGYRSDKKPLLNYASEEAADSTSSANSIPSEITYPREEERELQQQPPSLSEKVTGPLLGLKDTMASKVGYGGGGSTLTSESMDVHHAQSDASQQGYRSDEQPTSLSEKVTEPFLGLKDTVASQVGYGGEGSTRTSESTDVHHAQSDASQQGYRSDEQPTSLSENVTGPLLGLKDTMASKVGFGGEGSTRTSESTDVQHAESDASQQGYRSDEQPSSVSEKVTGPLLGLKDTVASKVGYGGEGSTRTSESTDVYHAQRDASQQGYRSDEQPTSVSEKVTGPLLGLKDTAASKVGYGGEGSTRTSESTDVHHAQSDASWQGYRPDEQPTSFSEKVTGPLLGLKDTVASKLGYGGEGSTLTSGSTDMHHAQSDASQQGYRSDEQPTSLSEKVTGPLLGLKDTVASKVGYGGEGSTRTSESTDVHRAQSDASQQGYRSDEQPTSLSEKVTGPLLGLKNTVASKVGYGGGPTLTSESTDVHLAESDASQQGYRSDEKALPSYASEEASDSNSSANSIASEITYQREEERELQQQPTSLSEKVTGSLLGLKDVVASKVGYGGGGSIDTSDKTQQAYPNHTEIDASQQETRSDKGFTNTNPDEKSNPSYAPEKAIDNNSSANSFTSQITSPGEEERELSKVITDVVSNSASTIKQKLVGGLAILSPKSVTAARAAADDNDMKEVHS